MSLRCVEDHFTKGAQVRQVEVPQKCKRRFEKGVQMRPVLESFRSVKDDFAKGAQVRRVLVSLKSVKSDFTKGVKITT